MRLFLSVFFISSLVTNALYSADTQEPTEKTGSPLPSGVDIMAKRILEEKARLLKEEEERVKKSKHFQRAHLIVSGLVSRVKKTKDGSLITLVVRNVWKGDGTLRQITFTYSKPSALAQSAANNSNEPLVHHRTKTLDTSSADSALSTYNHQRARSLGDISSDDKNIALHNSITAYLIKTGNEFHMGHGYILLGFEKKVVQ